MKSAKIIFDIFFLKAKPQDLPLWYPLLGITTLTSILTYILALDTVGSEISKVLEKSVSITPLAIAEHGFFAATVWMILRMRQRTERWGQAMIAMFGANTLAQLVMWPLAGWLMQEQGTTGANTPTMMLLFLRLWLLVVFANIFKETLDVRFGAGVLFTIGSWVFTSLLLLITVDSLV